MRPGARKRGVVPTNPRTQLQRFQRNVMDQTVTVTEILEKKREVIGVDQIRRE